MPILNPDDPVLRMPRGPQQPALPAPAPAPTPEPAPPFADSVVTPRNNQDATPIPTDLIGDIPPPPVPPAPKPTPLGVGVGGAPGAEGSTFARPSSVGIRPYRSAPAPAARFGPGIPITGSAALGGPSDALGLSPEEAAELLRSLAGGGR